MERPNHDLQAIVSNNKQSRAIGLTITIAIQVGAVIALVFGLAQAQLHKELDLMASVERQKVLPKAPPPPPPDLVRPPPPTAIIPQFAIEAPPPPAAPTVVKAAPPPAAVVAPTKLEPIQRTHTLPPYPQISQRLGESGTTLLKVTIGLDGNVSEAVVEKSSGSARLDQAAAEFVKAHWRWQPPTREGKPIVASTLVSVVWDLKNAE